MGLVLLVLAAFVAAATVGAQYMSIRRGRELNQVQNELAASKDDELKRELHARDEAVAESNRLAAEANDRAARLEVEAAQQKERAAVAERSLLELQKARLPRSLTKEQMDLFVSILRAAQSKCVIAIESSVGDSEAQRFASILEDAFKAVNWSASVSLAWGCPDSC